MPWRMGIHSLDQISPVKSGWNIFMFGIWKNSPKRMSLGCSNNDDKKTIYSSSILLSPPKGNFGRREDINHMIFC